MRRRALLFGLCSFLTAVGAQSTAAAKSGSTGDAVSADSHVVRPNETLSAIAAKYGISLERLLEHNPDVDPDRIRPGQKIAIGEEHRVVHYMVREGDTLGALARRFDVKLEDILRTHPGLRPDRLRIGQTLRIRTGLPASYSRSIGKPSERE